MAVELRGLEKPTPFLYLHHTTNVSVGLRNHPSDAVSHHAVIVPHSAPDISPGRHPPADAVAARLAHLPDGHRAHHLVVLVMGQDQLLAG